MYTPNSLGCVKWLHWVPTEWLALPLPGYIRPSLGQIAVAATKGLRDEVKGLKGEGIKLIKGWFKTT